MAEDPSPDDRLQRRVRGGFAPGSGWRGELNTGVRRLLRSVFCNGSPHRGLGESQMTIWKTHSSPIVKISYEII